MRKTGFMDIKRLQITDSSYIEGTICLVNENASLGVRLIRKVCIIKKHCKLFE